MELETLRFDEVLIKGHIRRHFRSKTDKLSEHWNTSCKVSLTAIDLLNPVIIRSSSMKGKENGKCTIKTGQRNLSVRRKISTHLFHALTVISNSPTI